MLSVRRTTNETFGDDFVEHFPAHMQSLSRQIEACVVTARDTAMDTY